jgi:hypothetical protein
LHFRSNMPSCSFSLAITEATRSVCIPYGHMAECHFGVVPTDKHLPCLSKSFCLAQCAGHSSLLLIIHYEGACMLFSICFETYVEFNTLHNFIARVRTP